MDFSYSFLITGKLCYISIRQFYVKFYKYAICMMIMFIKSISICSTFYLLEA